ncbi:MAG TPA: membrane protein insertase YidC [Acholeplasma sp.]
MRKIYLLLTVLAFVFVLFACSPDVTQIDAFIVPNKIVYSQSETKVSGGKTVPNVALEDFEYYAVRKNNTITRETLKLEDIIIEKEGLGIYRIEVKDEIYRVYLSQPIYVFDDEAQLDLWISGAYEREDNFTAAQATTETLLKTENPSVYYRVKTTPLTDFENHLEDFEANAYTVGALTFNPGLNETQKLNAVKGILLTPQATKVNFDPFRISIATYQTTSQDHVLYTNIDDNYVTYPETYDQDIFKMSATHNINLHSGTYSTIITTRTYKPADNELPINWNLEHNLMGYIWDFVLIIPISFIMSIFGGLFGLNSFAIGILFTTIIVRTIAWPIYARTNDMSIKMALAQPEMAKLQQKYAMRKDPASQQKMQMEMMALYKKHGISILGCFTPLLQMPIFLAMFQTVYRITRAGGVFTQQVSHTTIFGLDFLNLASGGWSEPFTYVLAAIVGITMWLLQKISSKKPSYAKNTGTQVKTEQQLQTERTMKMVSWVMIGMMVLTTMASVNALGFYWVIGNLYSLGQSMINRKLNEKKYEKARNAQSIV